ncbi:hypothetical protein [Streptomyces sp. NPDC091268]|uniref:hypothetical protein n=1 Tax=Streptomyces sp. NPDC091268 TaxID=3365979 RepID=UPI003814A629
MTRNEGTRSHRAGTDRDPWEEFEEVRRQMGRLIQQTATRGGRRTKTDPRAQDRQDSGRGGTDH